MKKLAEEAVKMRERLMPVSDPRPLVYPKGSPEYEKARRQFEASQRTNSNYNRDTMGTVY